ncbi:MAG: hypothetical protein M3077_09115 [Candidatus Dormibacteraeota bacterium]|nr:hypothetical protein [Candidatus Dormibacteraeota bacterium]
MAPLDRFDEGVTLTKAALAAGGRIPYRDFWITYGPLDTYVLAAAFKLIAVNVMVERALGALVLVLFGVAAYALMRYLRLRPPIRYLMTGLLTIAPLSLGAFNAPFLAILLGLAALLVFLRSVDQPARRWPILCGVLVGGISFGRPEFALALGVGLGAGYLVLALHRASPIRTQVFGYVAAVLATGTAAWSAMILLAGFNSIWFDIVVHALSLYAPGRSIPFGQGDDRVVVVLLGGASALVWLVGAVRAIRHRTDPLELARIVALLVVAVLAFTWVRTRADGIHAFEAWPMTGVLLGLLLERRARRQTPAPPRFEAMATLVGILLFCLAAGSLTLRDFIRPHAAAEIPRAGVAGQRSWMPSTQLAELIRQIDTAAPPGQPIWVGLQRNDLVVFNDAMLYFLSGRDPGTVYYESFPGLTNTEPMEQTIACQLATSGVTLAVLGPNTQPEPWNLSSVAGSTYLDRWLAARTVSHREIGPYTLLRLRPGPPPTAPCS